MTPTELFLSDDDHPTQTKDGDLDSESWSPIAHLTSAKLLMDAQLPSSDDHLGVKMSMDIPRRLGNESSFPYPSKKVRDAFSSAARSQSFKARSLAVGEHRLPLGTTQIWNDLDKAKKAQGLLRAAVEWIAGCHARRTKDRDLKKQLEVGLLSLPWRDSFWGFDCSLITYESLIGILSEFSYARVTRGHVLPHWRSTHLFPTPSHHLLSTLRTLGPLSSSGNNWFGESVVNFLIACVIEASSRPSQRDGSQIYGLIPSDCLTTALAAPIIKTSLEAYQFESALVRDFHLPYTGLSDMADYIENNPGTIWFLPICHHSHWFMVRVDVQGRSCTLYDSLRHGTAPPKVDALVLEALEALLGVLRVRIPVDEFTLASMAQQSDSFSCGPAVVNVVESEVLGEEEFDPKRAAVSRM
ncbi:BZ3500_MvSof-1268-A1-R1_Chr1-3g02160 [Microbotryum saponariae]|uniref:BZ3500_MvSof-1268-A1-R1_Chr1-3g02160 protein n=1 Tax=Microbotryum saponariae TaxID=289078 RepID=A0A2X0MTY8_9BASI|nr:BZ3500_MvSof-1268-A1-R1_Chr1-3g02160 [Microbotryum saponariae]SCZ95535.1 BZ3501_MvSof-1269-A2-R1_Chr1-3g01763 [Microbotryum saponariae]